MEIKLGGEFVVSKKPDDVYAFLVDPNRFCPLTIQDDKSFLVKLRVGISHIRGTAAMKLALAEAVKPTHAVYEGQGEVPGGNATLRAGFDLEPASGGTKVLWSGRAHVLGRIASLAGGLLEPLAKKNLQKLIDALQAALN
jgi:carbon monoxide dehydrogenase subunit G